jgi:geranylgeranyl reductase family protein
LKDVIVVGSGPAGAMAAKTAAEKGLSVLLLDKKAFPRYKQCGGGLTARVTNIIPASEIEQLPSARKNHGLCIVSPSQKHVAKYYREGNSGYFVSRIHFDHYLHTKAIDAGAIFKQERVSLAKYCKNGVEVITKEKNYAGRLLIIANGFYSRLPAMFGFPTMKDPKYIGYSLNSESPIKEEILDKFIGEKRLTTIFLGIAKNGYGYVFAMKNRINIGVGGTLKHISNIKQLYVDFLSILKKFYNLPELQLTKPQGYQSPFYKPMKKAYTDRIMIAGDAGWMVNALTGEGTYYALLSGKYSGETAIKAIEHDDTSADFLQEYNDRWTNSFGRDLSKYAFPLKNMFFKNDRRMELAVKMAKKDEKMMDTLTKTIVNVIPCREGFRKLLKRGPAALIKGLF